MTFLRTVVLCLASVLTLAARITLDQYREGSPEATIVALLRAMYSNDVAAFEQLTMPNPERSRLTAGGKRNDERLRALSEDPGSVQIKIKRAFQMKGNAARADAKGEYPAGTTVRYSVAHQGSPMIVSLVKQTDGWKVDPRWWIAMTHLTGEEPPRTSPDYAIKNLLLAMLALNKTAASRFITSEGKLDLLWTDAPRYREPSGVLEASVIEMPLVEIGPGEFVEMPSGHIAEGAATADRKVLIGLFGPTEMGFVVRKVGPEWRVESEPYFVLLNR